MLDPAGAQFRASEPALLGGGLAARAGDTLGPGQCTSDPTGSEPAGAGDATLRDDSWLQDQTPLPDASAANSLELFSSASEVPYSISYSLPQSNAPEEALSPGSYTLPPSGTSYPDSYLLQSGASVAALGTELAYLPVKSALPPLGYTCAPQHRSIMLTSFIPNLRQRNLVCAVFSELIRPPEITRFQLKHFVLHDKAFLCFAASELGGLLAETAVNLILACPSSSGAVESLRNALFLVASLGEVSIPTYA